jgi:hypothetical protein
LRDLRAVKDYLPKNKLEKTQKFLSRPHPDLSAPGAAPVDDQLIQALV